MKNEEGWIRKFPSPFQSWHSAVLGQEPRFSWLMGRCTGQISPGPFGKEYPLGLTQSEASSIKVGKPSCFAWGYWPEPLLSTWFCPGSKIHQSPGILLVLRLTVLKPQYTSFTTVRVEKATLQGSIVGPCEICEQLWPAGKLERVHFWRFCLWCSCLHLSLAAALPQEYRWLQSLRQGKSECLSPDKAKSPGWDAQGQIPSINVCGSSAWGTFSAGGQVRLSLFLLSIFRGLTPSPHSNTQHKCTSHRFRWICKDRAIRFFLVPTHHIFNLD